MNQSQFLAISFNSLEAREKSRVHGAIGFAFDSHWLKNWHESFKPITKRSNRNHLISFDCHLKTALYIIFSGSCHLFSFCLMCICSFSFFPFLLSSCCGFFGNFSFSCLSGHLHLCGKREGHRGKAESGRSRVEVSIVQFWNVQKSRRVTSERR